LNRSNRYGPGEKSVMHEHPDSVAVLLTESHITFTAPDGKSVKVDGKVGDVLWRPGEKHNPENTGDKPFK
jgi:RNase P/RNase MRP subunit p29